MHWTSRSDDCYHLQQWVSWSWISLCQDHFLYRWRKKLNLVKNIPCMSDNRKDKRVDILKWKESTAFANLKNSMILTAARSEKYRAKGNFDAYHEVFVMPHRIANTFETEKHISIFQTQNLALSTLNLLIPKHTTLAQYTHPIRKQPLLKYVFWNHSRHVLIPNFSIHFFLLASRDA